MGESKSRAHQSERKQLSLADAFAVGGTTRTRTTSTTGRDARGNARGNASVSKDLLQRALAYAPASAYTDVRLVCKAWRDAVDDDGFLPMLKLNRSLAVGDEETRTEQGGLSHAKRIVVPAPNPSPVQYGERSPAANGGFFVRNKFCHAQIPGVVLAGNSKPYPFIGILSHIIKSSLAQPWVCHHFSSNGCIVIPAE